MSVIMTLRIQGDPKKLEDFASRNPDGLRAIGEQSKKHGVIAHRFYGSDDGQILVIDEWPDEQSFMAFFAEQREPIGGLMREVSVTSEPQPRFWRKLETKDEIGWGA